MEWIKLHTDSGNIETLISSSRINIAIPITVGTRLYIGDNGYWDFRESPDEILAILDKPDTEIASLKARIKELDDALLDSQAHLAWAEQDSKALSEVRQAARELSENIFDYGYKYMPTEDSGIGDAWQLIEDSLKKLETLLEKP